MRILDWKSEMAELIFSRWKKKNHFAVDQRFLRNSTQKQEESRVFQLIFLAGQSIGLWLYRSIGSFSKIQNSVVALVMTTVFEGVNKGRATNTILVFLFFSSISHDGFVLSFVFHWIFSFSIFQFSPLNSFPFFFSFFFLFSRFIFPLFSRVENVSGKWWRSEMACKRGRRRKGGGGKEEEEEGGAENEEEEENVREYRRTRV